MINAKDYLKEGIVDLGVMLASLGSFTTKFTKQSINGSSVSVPVVTGGTAKTKGATGAYDLTGSPAATDIEVSLTHVYVPFDLDITEANSSGFGHDLKEKTESALEALGEKVMVTALADMVNFELSSTIAVADFDGSEVKGLASDLDDAAVPAIGRTIVADSGYFNNLLPEATDTIKVSVADYGFEGAPITAGILPDGVNAVALGKRSYAVASALPSQTNSGKFIVWEDIVTDAGVPVRVKVWEEPHGLQGIVETRIGGKVAVAGKGVKIASA
jgi:hypothetical protein